MNFIQVVVGLSAILATNQIALSKKTSLSSNIIDYFKLPKVINPGPRDQPPDFTVGILIGSSEQTAIMLCSGALVAADWVLTACRGCLRPDQSNEDLFVRRAFQNKTLETETILVKNTFISKECQNEDTARPGHSVGLIQTQSPFKVDQSLFAKLTTKPFVEQGRANSWVLSTYRAKNTIATTLPEAIWYVKVGLFISQACALSYPDGSIVEGKNLCASYYHLGMSNYCSNDVGAPLTYERNLIGMLLQKEDCGKPSFPAIFVNVSSHFQWINKVMKNNTIRS